MRYLFIAIVLLLANACGDGSHFIEGPAGPQGEQGVPGVDGLDGTDGQDGQDGKDAILEVIDPCGDSEGQFDELLFRLADGTLMVYFEDGSRRFLTVIGPGNYRTTDRQQCLFAVKENLEVTW